jgi:hypothetical protein
MATRSFICKKNPDGTVNGVYCHWDGYPRGVGSVLRQHYTDPAKVDALLALGALSSLGQEVGEAHDFDAPTAGWTIAYHRDRGEELDPGMMYPDEATAVRCVAEDLGVEYMYLFDGGEWRTHST